MKTPRYWIAYKTIATKEVRRFTRIWIQTILPPAITMTLYFIIFGNLIGSRIGQMGGFSYIQYIAPGLIMMSIITNAYANVVSSFFGSKFQKHIEEMLVAPIPNSLILLGYVTGGVARGACVGIVVTAVALFFTDLGIHSWWVMITTVLLTTVLFSLGAIINGIYARNFDDTSVIATFVLTPLTYLGGVFYSTSLLPQPWQTLTFGNPILYMVNAFRYSILGVSDIPVSHAFMVLLGFIIVLWTISLRLLNKGVGIRT